MRRVTIFVVVAEHDHECSNVIRSFLLKPVAELFAAACRAHDELKPECPPAEETPENDLLWARWTKATARWLKHHPAGSDTSHCDIYSVQEIELW